MMSQRRIRIPTEGQFCNYPHRTCMQNRVDGSEYCIRHVLEDKNGFYKQCTYMSNKNGKRCTAAVHKSDKKDGYCFEHARRAYNHKLKMSRKRKPRESPETLLEQVEHYASKTDDARDTRRVRIPAETIANKVLDYASSSDSESEQTLIDQVWRGDGDSDADSVDSENEDHLKHAGIYTAEEVAQITRDKLIRLQCLYIEQFKRLLHVMKERRRKYLHEVHRERDTLGSLHAAKEDPEEREKYDRLVAANRYHQRFGKEALLHRQLKEQRIAVTEGANSKPPSYPKCIFSRKGIRCATRTIPLSKYCSNHILHDNQQVLYQMCGYGNGVCKCPVAMAMVGDMGNCAYHKKLVQEKQRYPPPTEMHMDESLDVVGEVEVKMEVDSEVPTSVTSSVASSVTSSASTSSFQSQAEPSPMATSIKQET